jgi:competence protein ComEC
MLSFWQNIPFARLLIAYVVGIFACTFFIENINPYFALVIFCFLFFAFTLSIILFKKFVWLSSFFAITIFIVLGILTFSMHYPKNDKLHFSHYISYDLPCIVKGKVIENPNTTANAQRIKLDISQVVFKTISKNCEGEVLLYLGKHDSIALGDEILAKCSFKEISSPEFPFEFNFKNHWFTQQIFQQGFILSYKKIGKKYTLKSLALVWRNKAKSIYSKHFSKKEHVGLISALVLGDDDDIDKNIIRDFRDNGTIHILSVSGMHVGLIYFGIVFLIDKLPFQKSHKRRIRWILILAFIWMYAFITGLSAPVTRAALMCSFVEMGNFFQRKNNLYNNISCAAFLQLLFNPFLIFNIGFQLSYSAVFGLIYILPKLNGIIFHSNKYIQWILEMINVTIAAQLATLPFILFYFAQFPLYFIISNIAIGLLSTLAIYGGIIFLVFNSIPYLNTFLVFLNEIILSSILQISHYISVLPFSVIHFNRISIFETILLLGVIYSLFYLIQYFNFRRLFQSLFLLFVLIIAIGIRKYSVINQNVVIETQRKKFAANAVVLRDKLFIKTNTINDSANYEEWQLQLKKYYQIKSQIEISNK